MENLLDVDIGKYRVIQSRDGSLRALRNDEEWRDCVGDNLILALAQEIENLRDAYEDLSNRLIPAKLNPINKKA